MSHRPPVPPCLARVADIESPCIATGDERRRHARRNNHGQGDHHLADRKAALRGPAHLSARACRSGQDDRLAGDRRGRRGILAVRVRTVDPFFPRPRPTSEIKFEFVDADTAEAADLDKKPERLGDSDDQHHAPDEQAAPDDVHLHTTIVTDLERMQTNLAKLLNRWRESRPCWREGNGEESMVHNGDCETAACRHNQEASGYCFGLFVWVVLQEHPDTWGFGRYEKDGVQIRSMTYFRLDNPPPR